LVGKFSDAPKTLSRIVAGNVYNGKFYFMTDNDLFFDPNMDKVYIHEGTIQMNPSICPKDFCPFSNTCKSVVPEVINSFCAEIDDVGYPRLNTNPDCMQWCIEGKDRCLGIADAFCRNYPDHPACGCANYTNSEEYKSVLDRFITKEDIKSSSIIPSPVCWAPVCTQGNDPTNKNRPLMTSLMSRAQCSGLDLTFCNMYTKVSDTGGNVTISDNVYNQYCGNKSPSSGNTNSDGGNSNASTSGTSGGTSSGGNTGNTDNKNNTSGSTEGSKEGSTGGNDSKPNSGILDSIKNIFGVGTSSTKENAQGNVQGNTQDTKGDTQNGNDGNNGILAYITSKFPSATNTQSNSSSNTQNSSSGTSLSKEAIIGIVVGVVVFIIAMIMLGVWWASKNKK
jgi:hypothetical protein